MRRFWSLLLALLLLLFGTGLSEAVVEDGVAMADYQVSKGDVCMVEFGMDYSKPDEVALYLHAFRELPPNFMTKREAERAGWDKNLGNLFEATGGCSIGGDFFGNYEGLLPDARGRRWFECDVNYYGGSRGAERLVFSSDGMICYSKNHYKSYVTLYEGWYDLGDGGKFNYGEDRWSYADWLYGK